MHVPKPISKKAGRTKEEIIAAIQEVAGRLGRVPTSREFAPLSGISAWQVTGRFGTYGNAVRAAGLEPDQRGVKVHAAALLEDWGKVVRKVGAVPTRGQYKEAGSYSPDCYTGRFGSWVRISAEFTRFVASGALEDDWADVVERIRKGPIPQQAKPRCRCGTRRQKRPTRHETTKRETTKHETWNNGKAAQTNQWLPE